MTSLKIDLESCEDLDVTSMFPEYIKWGTHAPGKLGDARLLTVERITEYEGYRIGQTLSNELSKDKYTIKYFCKPSEDIVRTWTGYNVDEICVFLENAGIMHMTDVRKYNKAYEN